MNPRKLISSINILLKCSFLDYQRYFHHIYHYYIQKYNKLYLTAKKTVKILTFTVV